MELQEKEETEDYDHPEMNEETENSEKRLYNDFHGPSIREEENHLGLNITESSSSVVYLKKVCLILIVVSLQF